MTTQKIIDRIRFLSRTDAVTFTDEEILDSLNSDYGELINAIFQTAGDFSLLANKATKDLLDATVLVAGQEGVDGRYCLPGDLVRLTRVELGNGETFRKVKFYDLNDNDTSEQSPDKNGGQGVRIMDNELVIRPIPTQNVSGGLVLWYEQRQSELVNAVNEEPLLDPAYHNVLVYRAVLSYMMRNPETFNPLIEKKGYLLEKEMKKDYSHRYPLQKVIRPLIENFK